MNIFDINFSNIYLPNTPPPPVRDVRLEFLKMFQDQNKRTLSSAAASFSSFVIKNNRVNVTYMMLTVLTNEKRGRLTRQWYYAIGQNF
jgi:hypothetical protein